MMRAIDEVKQELTYFPSIPHSAEETRILIPATDSAGFDVVLIEGERETTVCCEGWHDHFESIKEAVGCFLWSLTPRYRLRVLRFGGSPYCWTLQSLRDGKWVSHGTTTLIFLPFWRKWELVYRQNAHIDPNWAQQGTRDEAARH
jgi:hypothetical protein